jgi:transposase
VPSRCAVVAGFGGCGKASFAMGAKLGPAVRLCSDCGQLKPADQFPPGRARRLACLTCQAVRKTGRTSAQDRHRSAAEHARARNRALRRLAGEHVDTYREFYGAKLLAIPATIPRSRARRRAVSQALRAVEQQHRPRYQQLYREELAKARSKPLSLRRGRPPGAPDRLSIGSQSAGSTWRRDGSVGRRRRARATKGARQRSQEAVRERAVELFGQGVSASSVARELGVARQTAVDWQARWRSGGTAALRSHGPSRRPAVPDHQLPAIEEALLKGAGAHGFDGDVWTSTRVGVVIQRATGVQLGSKAVQRLLRERLGWRFQPAAAGALRPLGDVAARPGAGQGAGQGRR